MNSYPSLKRRLGAIAYDWLLCLACIFVFTGIIVTFNKGLAISSAQKPFYVFGLLLLIFYYFIGFWWHGGQTPGMKVWHLRLVSDVNPPQKMSLYIRLFTVIGTAGLTLFTALSNKDRVCFHDKISKTHLIFSPEK